MGDRSWFLVLLLRRKLEPEAWAAPLEMWEVGYWLDFSFRLQEKTWFITLFRHLNTSRPQQYYNSKDMSIWILIVLTDLSLALPTSFECKTSTFLWLLYVNSHNSKMATTKGKSMQNLVQNGRKKFYYLIQKFGLLFSILILISDCMNSVFNLFLREISILTIL